MAKVNLFDVISSMETLYSSYMNINTGAVIEEYDYCMNVSKEDKKMYVRIPLIILSKEQEMMREFYKGTDSKIIDVLNGRYNSSLEFDIACSKVLTDDFRDGYLEYRYETIENEAIEFCSKAGLEYYYEESHYSKEEIETMLQNIHFDEEKEFYYEKVSDEYTQNPYSEHPFSYEKGVRKLIHYFMNMTFPNGTKELGLKPDFIYYYILCRQFIKRKKKLTRKVIELDKETEDKILNYIEDNKGTADGDYMQAYYSMLKVALHILKQYYNQDGTLKENK